METDMKARVFKMLCIIAIVLAILTFGLKKYNEYQLNETIELAVETVGITFNAHAEYNEASSRIIVNKQVDNENELIELTRKALPNLSVIGDYDFIDLLSVRAYYDEKKTDFQYYDIKFSNIKKLEWKKINTFDDFLNQINLMH